ncbi:putative clathrin assembly protein [Platanthera guangdongensis]|uniref:Clathrin assembly protein n=1 Tax=Platanthera guangdongensis TaxID=2320717 RepID=A0ABR2LDY6_9ASPA
MHRRRLPPSRQDPRLDRRPKNPHARTPPPCRRRPRCPPRVSLCHPPRHSPSQHVRFPRRAHSSSWDHSAFIRTFALYLDQRLECIIQDQKHAEMAAAAGILSVPSRADTLPAALPVLRSKQSQQYQGGGNYERNSNSHYSPTQVEERKPATPLREMKPEKVFARMNQLQQLLDRFLACRPTGAAKDSRLVLIALYPIVRDSFQLYADICEILAVLLDRYFEMEYADCLKTFEAYGFAAKQIDELSAFYGWCKNTGVARSSEYPEVQRISDKLLETLEEFTRDRAKMPPKSPPRRLDPVPVVQVEEPPLDINTIKALPAPSDYVEQPSVTEEPKTRPPQIPPQPPADLVDLREDTVTADAQGNKLALALFSAGATNAEWEPFPSASGGDITSAWQTPAAEQGKADWEHVLVETTSNLAKQKAALGGGFDPLLLNGMYDQGAVRARQCSGEHRECEQCGLAGAGKTAKPILALPAPDGSFQSIGGGDPFAASLSVPPPSYVQMSDIEKKQQLLVQERLLWDQYGREGMQGQQGLSSLNNAYYFPNPVMQYGIPQPAPYYYPHM